MSLIVEDGTGMANAESYASVAAADERLGALGLTIWSGMTTTEKEQALRRAAQYMVQAYRCRWAGARVKAEQALDWPRWGVRADGFDIASTAVPADIVNACIYLAFKAAAGDLNADLGPDVVREKVGPIETEYAPHAPRFTRYRSIDMALKPYLTGGGAMASLVRT